MNSSSRLRCFERWKTYLVEQYDMRVKLMRMSKLCLKNHKAFRWMKWKNIVEERVLEKIGEAFCDKKQSQMQRRILVAWREIIVIILQQKKVMTKFIARMKNQVVVNCFSYWTEYITQRKYDRKLAGKVFAMIANKSLMLGFTQWRHFKNEEVANELANSRRNSRVSAEQIAELKLKMEEMQMANTTLKVNFRNSMVEQKASFVLQKTFDEWIENKTKGFKIELKWL